jgi:serine/threonine protein kinase
MERLRGQDLAELLRIEPRFDLARTVELVRDLATGIDVAHRAGIVHRDLKPQNTFLAHRPNQKATWTIVDFGLSKLLSETATLTHGGIVGTPAYMAPEQASGSDVDVRVDVYSIAAVAYRALTGRPPFAAPDLMTVLHDVVHKMPPRPRAFADVPPEVEWILALGLAKDREHRFTSAPELSEALAQAVDGRIRNELKTRAEEVLGRHPWSGWG